ncbi:hypothetical protein HQ590_16000 [bacterium]|nr:hypothetical protein [bacterium]
MIRVFLLAGQSNMVGQGVSAELPADRRASPANVRLFEESGWHGLPWQERFGPEVGFAHQLSAACPADQIVLVKVASSGANLYYDWNPDGVSRGPEDTYRGPLYPQLAAAVGVIRTHFSKTGDPFEFAGTLWLQGERDAVFEFMAESYEQNLAAFVAVVRQETGNRALPFLIGRIAPRVYRLDEQRYQHAFRHIVQDAQRRVAQNDLLVGLVETTDLPQYDNLHFDTGGQIELGRRFAWGYLALVAAGS